MIPTRAAPPRKTPIITWSLIAINTAIFLYLIFKGGRALEIATMKYGMIPIYILRGRKLYTLITSMFLHGSLYHLIGNMIYLHVFGSSVESRLGRMKYLALYLLSGIFASIAHIIIQLFFAQPIIIYGPYLVPVKIIDPLKIPCIGASGAISGVLGAYLIMFPYSKVGVMTYDIFGFPIMISVPAYVFIGFWFIYQLYMGFMSLVAPFIYYAGVAFWAHIGGFIGGLILCAFMGGRRRKKIYWLGRRWYDIPVYALTSNINHKSTKHFDLTALQDSAYNFQISLEQP